MPGTSPRKNVTLTEKKKPFVKNDASPTVGGDTRGKRRVWKELGASKLQLFRGENENIAVNSVRRCPLRPLHRSE